MVPFECIANNFRQRGSCIWRDGVVIKSRWINSLYINKEEIASDYVLAMTFDSYA